MSDMTRAERPADPPASSGRAGSPCVALGARGRSAWSSWASAAGTSCWPASCRWPSLVGRGLVRGLAAGHAAAGGRGRRGRRAGASSSSWWLASDSLRVLVVGARSSPRCRPARPGSPCAPPTSEPDEPRRRRPPRPRHAVLIMNLRSGAGRRSGSSSSAAAASAASSRSCSAQGSTCSRSPRTPSRAAPTSSAWPAVTARRRWSPRWRAGTASRSS